MVVGKPKPSESRIMRRTKITYKGNAELSDVKYFTIEVDDMKVVTVTGFDKEHNERIIAKGSAVELKDGDEILAFAAEPFIMKAVIESGNYGIERQLYLLERLSRRVSLEDSEFIHNEGYDSFDYSVLKDFPRLTKNMRVYRQDVTSARYSKLVTLLKRIF